MITLYLYELIIYQNGKKGKNEMLYMNRCHNKSSSRQLREYSWEV